MRPSNALLCALWVRGMSTAWPTSKWFGGGGIARGPAVAPQRSRQWAMSRPRGRERASHEAINGENGVAPSPSHASPLFPSVLGERPICIETKRRGTIGPQDNRQGDPGVALNSSRTGSVPASFTVLHDRLPL